jgi:hypothetical protein
VADIRIAIVEISNCPTYFLSIIHKQAELQAIYKFMLEIAEKIDADEIYFKTKQPLLH